MTNAVDYFQNLSDSYREYLGGLQWSPHEDAMQFCDGTVFAFNEEIALFLEGLASAGRLIEFPCTYCGYCVIRGIFRHSVRGG